MSVSGGETCRQLFPDPIGHVIPSDVVKTTVKVAPRGEANTAMTRLSLKIPKPANVS